MRAWGFSVGSVKGQPVVLGVEAIGTRAAAQAGRQFVFPASVEDDLPEQMRRLADAVETAFSNDTPDAVVFRLLDHSKFGRAEKTTRSHALAEGVVLAMAKRAVPSVIALPPVQLAHNSNSDKDSLDAEAESIFGKKFAEAGAAAIAGLEILARP